MENQSDSGAPPYGAPQAPISQGEPARMGPLQRIFGVLFSPGETFADINRKPTLVSPIIVAMIMALIGTVVFSMRVKVDWDKIARDRIRAQVEKTGGSMPAEEQIQQQVNITKMIGKLIPILIVVGTPIYYVILAGIFALALMIIQAKSTFKKIFSVVLWSGAATGIVGTIIVCASLMVRDTEGLDPSKPGAVSPTNLAAYLPTDIPKALDSGLAGCIHDLVLDSALNRVRGRSRVETNQYQQSRHGSLRLVDPMGLRQSWIRGSRTWRLR